MSQNKSSGSYVIGQPGITLQRREEKERNQMNQMEKKKAMASSLYYGVVSNKNSKVIKVK